MHIAFLVHRSAAALLRVLSYTRPRTRKSAISSHLFYIHNFRDGHPVLPVPLLHTRFCNNLPELFCTWQCVSMCSRCSTPMVGSGRGVEDASFPRHPYHACLECPFRGARRRSSISCQVFCASNAWPGIYDRLSHGSNNPMVRLRVETVFLNLCLSSCAVLRSSRYWL